MQVQLSLPGEIRGISPRLPGAQGLIETTSHFGIFGGGVVLCDKAQIVPPITGNIKTAIAASLGIVAVPRLNRSAVRLAVSSSIRTLAMGLKV